MSVNLESIELTTNEMETEDQTNSEVSNRFGDKIRQGLTTTDLYDLVLTAIAFLGFGTFVMNLVMDAMAVSV